LSRKTFIIDYVFNREKLITIVPLPQGNGSFHVSGFFRVVIVVIVIANRKDIG